MNHPIKHPSRLPWIKDQDALHSFTKKSTKMGGVTGNEETATCLDGGCQGTYSVHQDLIGQ